MSPNYPRGRQHWSRHSHYHDNNSKTSLPVVLSYRTDNDIMVSVVIVDGSNPAAPLAPVSTSLLTYDGERCSVVA